MVPDTPRSHGRRKAGRPRLTVTQQGGDDVVSSQPIGVFDFLAAPQEPGEIGRLGAYRVLGVLGEGGMGIVLRAEDTVLHRPVAIKVLQPKASGSTVARARFLREARAAAAVDHPNVVPILHVGEEGGTPYLVMPLLKGRTLAALLAVDPLPPINDIFWVGRAVAEGLAAAHELGLVHRDIKPANIWIEDGGKTTQKVKILDFGLARLADGESGDSPGIPNDGGITAAGIAMGTPQYMSPEQARAKPLDPRSDLFSLGIVLYEMCAGRMPFDGDDPLAVLAAVATHHPPQARDLNPKIPPGLNDLLQRMLAKRIEDRPASAREVSAELKQQWLALTRPASRTAEVLTVRPVDFPSTKPPSAENLRFERPSDRDQQLTTVSPYDRADRPRRKRPTRRPQSTLPRMVLGSLIGIAILVWAGTLYFAGVGSRTATPEAHAPSSSRHTAEFTSPTSQSVPQATTVPAMTVPAMTVPTATASSPGTAPTSQFPPPPSGLLPPRGGPPPPR